jgi:hypothetical protein
MHYGEELKGEKPIKTLTQFLPFLMRPRAMMKELLAQEVF